MRSTFKFFLILIISVLLSNPILLAGTTYAIQKTRVEIVYEDPTIATQNLKIGDEFTVNVNFSNPVEGAKTLAGVISYNPNLLELQGEIDEGTKCIMIEPGEISKSNQGNGTAYVYDSVEKPGKIVFLFTTDGTILNAGTIATIKFKLKGISEDNYKITVEKIRYVEDVETEEAEENEFEIEGENTSVEGNIDTTEPEFIIGDVNSDKRVTFADYALILRHVKKAITLEGNQFKAADLNGDNKITFADYALLLGVIKRR